MKRAPDSGLTETAPCGYRAAPMRSLGLAKKSIATGKRVLRARKAMARR